MMIFLMGLLCLVSGDKLFSQQCFKISYDKNGNRILFTAVKCVQFLRDDAVDVEVMEVVENEDDMEQKGDLSVYPNPNDGVFRLDVTSECEDAEVQIYNNKGVLVSCFQLDSEMEVDIRDNPSGAYLLRVFCGDCVRNEIVVKL